MNALNVYLCAYAVKKVTKCRELYNIDAASHPVDLRSDLAAENADTKACFGASGIAQQACKESFWGAEWESENENAAESNANER